MKQSTKQFLKPDWHKIVVLVIILVSIALLENFGMLSWLGNISIFIIMPIFVLAIFDLSLGVPYPFLLSLGILGIFIWWVIVCLIFHLYDKSKNKKEANNEQV